MLGQDTVTQSHCGSCQHGRHVGSSFLVVSCPCSFGFRCVCATHRGPGQVSAAPSAHPVGSTVQASPGWAVLHPGQPSCLAGSVAVRGPVDSHCPAPGLEPSTAPKFFPYGKVSFMCESGWAATPGIQPNPSSTWLPGCFADVIEVHGGLAPVRKGARDRLGRCEDGLRRLAPEQLQLQRPPAKRARPPSRLLSWRHSFSPSRPAVM